MANVFTDTIKILVGSAALATGGYVGFQSPDYLWSKDVDRMTELSKEPGVMLYKGGKSLESGAGVADFLSDMPLMKSGSSLDYYGEKAREAHDTLDSIEHTAEQKYDSALGMTRDTLAQADKVRSYVPDTLVKRVPRVGDKVVELLEHYDHFRATLGATVTYVDGWKQQQESYVAQYQVLEAEHSKRKKIGAGIGATTGLALVLLGAAGIRRRRESLDVVTVDSNSE